MGRQVNAALTTAVYRKSLKLSPAARQESTGKYPLSCHYRPHKVNLHRIILFVLSVGEIVNLMQLDARKIGNDFVPVMHNMWDGLYQIVGYTSAVIYYLGPSALVGILVMILIIPFQAIFMGKYFKLRGAMVKGTDERVKVVNEILQGIRVIKSYNWEQSFIEQVESFRADEMVRLRSASKISAVNSALMMAAPAFVALAALTTFSLSGGKILASTFFTAIMIFGQLRFPLMSYPMILAQYMNAKLAAGRLEKFLNSSEVSGTTAVAQENASSR